MLFRADMATVSIDGAELILPEGWEEHDNPGGPREFRPVTDQGVLQVSRFPAAETGFLSTQPDLAAVAKQLGARSGFPAEAVTKSGSCNLGRYGFAMFTGGEFPAMFVWVVLGHSGAWMWTWLGADPTSPESQSAVAIVLGAR